MKQKLFTEVEGTCTGKWVFENYALKSSRSSLLCILFWTQCSVKVETLLISQWLMLSSLTILDREVHRFHSSIALVLQGYWKFKILDIHYLDIQDSGTLCVLHTSYKGSAATWNKILRYSRFCTLCVLHTFYEHRRSHRTGLDPSNTWDPPKIV